MNKIHSFENVLKVKMPSVFCLQETKLKTPNQIKTESTKNFTIYELNRKLKNGGGLCIGVHKDLQPVWVAQGDDEVECLVVEAWVDDFPIRILNAYGPQLNDEIERKQKFWDFIERETKNAVEAGAGLIIQMDSNSHLGKNVIKDDTNDRNANGKLFCEFMERNPHLTIINSLQLCEGTITRMRKTSRGTEESVLDVFVTCDRILPFITRMVVDERRENVLTNYHALKDAGRVIESDHNGVELDINLKFSKVKSERIEFFQFKNLNSQLEFKKLTSTTTDFSTCFQNNLNFETQCSNWRTVLDNYFYKSFKKIRISNKPSKKRCEISELMDKRKEIMQKTDMNEKDDEEIANLEFLIADKCEEQNRKELLIILKKLKEKMGM